MIEKFRLGGWDYFVYLMTGTTLLMIITMHCLLTGVLRIEQALNVPAATLIALLLLALLLTGMLIEPLANLPYKLIKNKPGKWRDELGFRKWDEQIEDLKKETRKCVPEVNNDTVFQFAKNWALNHGNATEFFAFLSKYGFYRSSAFVFTLNAIATLFIYWFWWGAAGFVLNILLAILFSNRASVFYRHMSVSIYSQFIQGHKLTDSESKPRK